MRGKMSKINIMIFFALSHNMRDGIIKMLANSYSPNKRHRSQLDLLR